MILQAELIFDMHSEEKGTDPEDSVSFDIGRGGECPRLVRRAV